MSETKPADAKASAAKPAASKSKSAGKTTRSFKVEQNVKIDKKSFAVGQRVTVDLERFKKLKDLGVLTCEWNDGD